MRLIIQRVSHASVHIGGTTTASIGIGMLVLAGVELTDTNEDAEWLAGKTARLRIFADASGDMNLAAADVNAAFLVISQFTLFAETRKGNRPSYIRAARPEQAVPIYEHFVHCLERESNLQVHTGTFGADMQVELINDGPVTIIIDSRNRE